MANKKISQLTAMGNVGITDNCLFPIASGNVGGPYTTLKTTAEEVAEYALNPISATQVSGLNKDVYLNNSDSNWDTASNTVTQNPYLQVRLTDGKLVTGSGIANAVGGDNMGNCVATLDLKMQGLNITGAGNIGFGNNTSIGGLDRSRIYNSDGNGTDLQLLGYQDLTLSGNRHIDVNAQALDLADTPISGKAAVTGCNLEIDPDNKLILNKIDANGTTDNIVIEGSISNTPNATVNNASSVNWSLSNIQYGTIDQNNTTTFNNVADGQTLTMYIKNTDTDSRTVTFASGNAVVWGGEYGNAAPAIAANKTNLYTFVRVHTGIFASAVTGYIY